MSNDEQREGYCNAQTRDGGYCGRKVSQPDLRCYMHGGATPTKDENPDVGNPDAAGAAIDHGARSDPTNLYDNLDADEEAWVDEKVDAYLEAKGLERDTPDGDLVELAVMSLYQARSAHGVLFEEGLSRTGVKGTTEHGSVTDEEEHYLNRVVSQHTTDFRMALKDAGTLNDPESQKADAAKGLISVVSSEVNDGDE